MADFITKMRIKNLKCFKGEHTLDFANDKGEHCKWNIIIGNNGSGKSTVLAGAGIGATNKIIDLGKEFQIDFPFIPKAFFTEEDWDKSIIRLTMENHCEMEFSQWGESFSIPGRANFNVPAFVYGATRSIIEGLAWEPDHLKFNCNIFGNQSQISSPEEWLLDLHLRELATSKTSKFAKHKKAVIDTLVNVLPDVDAILFPKPKDMDSPSILFSTPYGDVPPDQLSGGYKTLMGWLVDLTRRMFDAYPNSKDPLAEPAIVVVDEIDLHLHPSWQIKLIDYLDERFKQTQFIVSAHSPLIVQSHPDANIILLEREGDGVVVRQDFDHISNWRIDQILSSDLFGTTRLTSKLEQDLVAEHSKLVAKAKRTKAEEKRLQEVCREMETKLPVGQNPEDRELHMMLTNYLREQKAGYSADTSDDKKAAKKASSK